MAAYGRSVGDKKRGLVAWLFDVIPGKSRREVNPNGEAILRGCGWNRWPDFVPENVLNQMKKSHLRVEVWTKKEPPSVVVAFGGTVFTSGKDWKSNLRWFLPKQKDEYSEIVDLFGPAFVDELCRRIRESEWAHLRNATIFSTGHSLGGGLAQQFAYSLPTNSEVPRVARVFAFDPSPVTGFLSVDKALRNKNKSNLRIDRIYERGEILAILRSLMSFLVKSSAKSPSIRGVRYSLFFPADPIRGHSILELASKIEIAISDRSA
jgi:pimeloyl-ACP methyl ester carboxylesterase